MGIYDRDYYRGSKGGFLDTITKSGQVCKWILGINIAVFIVQMLTRQTHPMGGLTLGPVTDFLILDTNKVIYQGQVWRLLTCAFMHSPGDILHIVFNMWLFWMFGRDLEDVYGSKEFLCFYLVSAVCASLATVLYAQVLHMSGALPWAQGIRALGASGAVMAVTLVYACHFPRRTILLFFVLPVSVWLFAVFCVAKDFYGLMYGERFVAVEAHLGGALFGFLYYHYSWRISPLISLLRMPNFRRNRPRLRVYKEETHPRDSYANIPKSNVDEQLEAKLDAILDKIKRHGTESLSESENKLLQQASEAYQQKRSSKGGV